MRSVTVKYTNTGGKPSDLQIFIPQNGTVGNVQAALVMQLGGDAEQYCIVSLGGGESHRTAQIPNEMSEVYVWERTAYALRLLDSSGNLIIEAKQYLLRTNTVGDLKSKVTSYFQGLGLNVVVQVTRVTASYQDQMAPIPIVRELNDGDSVGGIQVGNIINVQTDLLKRSQNSQQQPDINGGAKPKTPAPWSRRDYLLAGGSVGMIVGILASTAIEQTTGCNQMAVYMTVIPVCILGGLALSYLAHSRAAANHSYAKMA
ncbi:MAG: hypothetical protein JSS50_02800 [Proteobacteria bacterium]|nr:hypothetical protein [Pseudomonadota bacterium]